MLNVTFQEFHRAVSFDPDSVIPRRSKEKVIGPSHGHDNDANVDGILFEVGKVSSDCIETDYI